MIFFRNRYRKRSLHIFHVLYVLQHELLCLVLLRTLLEPSDDIGEAALIVAELIRRAIDFEMCRETLVRRLDFELEEASLQAAFRLNVTFQASETKEL
jgi:hypothetical protein